MAKRRYGKSIQLWPGGQSVTIDGDGDTLRVQGTDGRFRKPNASLARQIEIELLAEMYADKYILHNDTSFVDDMLKAAMSGDIKGELANEWQYEDIANMVANPEDWDLEQCREWLDDRGIAHPDPDPWQELDTDPAIEELRAPDERKFLLEEVLGIYPDTDEDEYKDLKKLPVEKLRTEVIRRINEEEIDGLDDWREAVRDHASNDQAEICEWYRVDSWLAKCLEENGECVLNNSYGAWWGRQATGQGYIMDGTLQEIAAHHV